MNNIFETTIQLFLSDPVQILSVGDGIEGLLGFKSEEFVSGRISLKNRIHAHDSDIAEQLFSPDISSPSGSFNIRLRQASGRVEEAGS